MSGMQENRYIAGLLSKELGIDENIGMGYYMEFLSSMEMLKAGVPYKELGYARRRASGAPSLYEISAEGEVTNRRTGNVFSETPDGILHMRLDGVMLSSSGPYTYGADYQAEKLRMAYQNDRIKAIVLEVNSGGGEALAGAMLSEAVAGKNKPVVAWVQIAASAAYLAISAADEIVLATPYAQVGSIGAYVSIDRAALAYYAENVLSIYATQSSDKNKDFRAALQGDFSGIQSRVDELAATFQKDVAKKRRLNMSDELTESTLAGGMFGGTDALKRGLADSRGDLNYTLKRAWQLSRRNKKA